MLLGVAKNQRIAAGTTLLTIIFPLSIGAVWTYYKKGDVDVPVAFTILGVYIIFATLGAKANYLVPEKYVIFSISFMLFLSTLYYLNKFIKMK